MRAEVKGFAVACLLRGEDKGRRVYLLSYAVHVAINMNKGQATVSLTSEDMRW